MPNISPGGYFHAQGFTITSRATLQSLSWAMINGSAAGQLSFVAGLYADDGGYPGELVANLGTWANIQMGNFAYSPTGGQYVTVTLATPLRLTPGAWWLGSCWYNVEVAGGNQYWTNVQSDTVGGLLWPSYGGVSNSVAQGDPGFLNNGWPLPFVTTPPSPSSAMLNANIASGTAITSITVTATSSAIASGDTILVTPNNYNNAQTNSNNYIVATASANVAAGATSIPVDSVTPSASFTAGDAFVVDMNTTPVLPSTYPSASTAGTILYTWASGPNQLVAQPVIWLGWGN